MRETEKEKNVKTCSMKQRLEKGIAFLSLQGMESVP